MDKQPASTLAAALLLAAAVGAAADTPLLPAGALSVSHTVQDSVLTLTLRTTSTGWVGFGIAEPISGSMPGADIAVWSDEGRGFELSDRYSTAFAYPLEDADGSSDWALVESGTADGVTTLVVSRPVDVAACNTQDRDVGSGFIPVIAAVGSTPFLSYHGTNRVATQLEFVPLEEDRYEVPESPADIEVIELVSDEFELSADVTAYYCQSFELPFDSKRHIVGVEGIVRGPSKDEVDPLVHHWTLYQCARDGPRRDPWAQYLTPGRCESGACIENISGWAPGSPDFVSFPGIAGYPAGPSENNGLDVAQYVMVEYHIDNPARLEGLRASFGNRIHYTDKLREHEVGTLVLGDIDLTLPAVPPGEEAFAYETVCPASCTEKLPFPINVFSVNMHMHKAGKMMYNTLHRRDLKDRGQTLGRSEFFDFNFQGSEELYPTVTLYPGDRINTHGVYDTRGRTAPTPMDVASDDEMLLSYLWYYPRIPGFSFCGRALGGVTACGDYSTLDDFLWRANPHPDDAEGPRDIDRVFGQGPTCNMPQGIVRGVLFRDLDGDGAMGAQEPVVVEGLLRIGREVFYADLDGRFQITGLAPGQYVLRAKSLDLVLSGGASFGLADGETVELEVGLE